MLITSVMDALNLALIGTPAYTNCHLEQAFHQGCHHFISPCQKHDAPAHPRASSFQRLQYNMVTFNDHLTRFIFYNFTILNNYIRTKKKYDKTRNKGKK